MQRELDLKLYLDVMIKEKAWSTKGNLQFFMDSIFGEIDFNDKKVLEIGGGSGLVSFYAACRGAKHVVCLEPEGAGSSTAIIEKFRKLSSLLQLTNVVLKPITFQEFDPEGESFDIVILHNSINHLDENACINLLKDDASKIIYKTLISKIGAVSSKGAKLIVCDCSNYNFFALLKIRNPFSPSIEWHKHQAPEIWAMLFKEAGFDDPEIEWTSFNQLRSCGKALLGNRLMAYFITSHFCLTMTKS